MDKEASNIDRLLERLAHVPRRRVRGRYWRHGDPTCDLDELPPVALVASRWQGEGDPPALHTSSSEPTAWKEHSKVLDGTLDPAFTRRKIGVIVVDLEVVDLTCPEVLEILGVHADDLVNDTTTCRLLGDAARALGIGAFLAPSAVDPAENTLVVFPVAVATVVADTSTVEIAAPRI